MSESYVEFRAQLADELMTKACRMRGILDQIEAPDVNYATFPSSQEVHAAAGSLVATVFDLLASLRIHRGAR